MKMTKSVKIDPLYSIFEEHLYNFQDSDEDRKTFVGNVIKDYLKFLNKNKVTVPPTLLASVVEELSTQVRAMLVKKIYGYPTISEFQKQTPKKARRSPRSRLSVSR
ncbi:hypothetical protein WDW86_14910 [Bdellovibrionota bacterium FG-2]